MAIVDGLRERGVFSVALLALAMALVSLGLPLHAHAAGTASVWDGTAVDTTWYSETETEYTLDSAADLAGLAQLVNDGNAFDGKTVKLVSDIDLGGHNWTQIGKVGAKDGKKDEKPFKGTFDAQKTDGTNAVISNLKISKIVPSTSVGNGYVGLFGLTNSPAAIKNVTLENVDVSGGLYVGAIVGMGYTGSEISNCHVKGAVKITGYWYVGGIGGNGYMGQVKNCTVKGLAGSFIKARNGSYVGGIWGYRGEGSQAIEDCAVEGISLSAVDRIGGICGIAHYGNTIKGCSVSNSSITSSNNIGNTALVAGADLSDATHGAAKILDCKVEGSTAFSDGLEITTKVGSSDHTGKPLIRQAVVGSDVEFDEKGKVTGGTIEQASAEDLAQNKVLVSNGKGEYSVEDINLDNASFVVTVGGTSAPYQTLALAMKAANETSGEDAVTVKIRTSGNYAPFAITRQNVTVETDGSAKATFLVNETVEGSINAKNVTLRGLDFVASGGATIINFGACDGLTLDGCTFTGNGEGTALYIHQPNITIKNCKFDNFERGYYTCGDNHAAGKMHFVNNVFNNVRVPIDGYWGKTATEKTDIHIKGNTFDSGDWDASYVQLWDYAQFLRWSGNKEADRQGSAIKATIGNNTYKGNVVIYATHCDWLSDTSLTLDDGASALLKRRYLIDLGAVESATIRNADGSEITAFNESTKATVVNGKAYIYSISEGDYIIEAKPSATSDALVSKTVTVEDVGLNKTNEVKFDVAPMPVAKVGEVTYTSLAEAIAAAKSGGTLDLLADVSVDTWQQVWDAKNLTVNGGGHKVTVGKVESASNGDYLFYGAENLKVSELTVEFKTNGNGFSLSSGELNNVTMAGGPTSKYAVFVDATAQGGKVVIDGCRFDGFKGAAIYSQPGTAGAKTSDLTVNGTTIENCGMAMCSYAQNTVFTNNTVTGGSEVSFAGAAEGPDRENTYVITGNAFNNAGKIWFYGATLDAVEFEGNKVLGTTFLYIGKTNAGSLEVSKNYWGGGEPSTGSNSGQIQGYGNKVTGTDVYYEEETMRPEDLNTYVPPVVTKTYKVSIKASEHGKVTADVDKAASGKIVTLKVTEDKGFKLNGLTVVDAAGKNVVVTAGKDGTYTFVMPSSDVAVTALFGCDGGALCPSKDFIDVDASEWYHAAIDWAVENDVLNGIGDTGRMDPLGKLTRAQMAAILYNVEGSPAVDIAAGNEFSDFDASAWYAKAVAWTAAKDLFQGYGTTGVFGANDVLTREQAAAVLMRWSAMNGRDVTARADLSSYPDVEGVSVWAKDCMSWAVAEGMINGIPTGNGAFELKATGTATRAQAASLMMNLVDK